MTKKEPATKSHVWKISQISDVLHHAVFDLKEEYGCCMDVKVIFPGWDMENELNPKAYNKIRAAARAILAYDFSFDECTEVTVDELLELIDYIASILEQ